MHCKLTPGLREDEREGGGGGGGVGGRGQWEEDGWVVSREDEQCL